MITSPYSSITNAGSGFPTVISYLGKCVCGFFVFFFPGLYHGMDAIDPEDEIDYNSKKGRWFFNYNLLESHHVKGRQSAIPYKPS